MPVQRWNVSDKNLGLYRRDASSLRPCRRSSFATETVQNSPVELRLTWQIGAVGLSQNFGTYRVIASGASMLSMVSQYSDVGFLKVFAAVDAERASAMVMGLPAGKCQHPVSSPSARSKDHPLRIHRYRLEQNPRALLAVELKQILVAGIDMRAG